MKQVLFSVFFLALMAVGANAQSTSCSKKSAAACQTKVAAASCGEKSAAAAKLASTDPTIETKKCEVSGSVAYYRKETADNGTVKMVSVEYDAASNTFVNVAPSSLDKSSTGCGGAKAASASGCCAGKAKATSASAGCCASKNKSASASSADKTAAPKPVKTASGTQQ